MDPLSKDLLTAVETLGVDLEKDLDGLAGPFGDVGGWDSAVEPGRHGGVTEVVRCAGQRRGGVVLPAGVNKFLPGIGRADGCLVQLLRPARSRPPRRGQIGT